VDELGKFPLDPLPLAPEELPCSIRVHQATLASPPPEPEGREVDGTSREGWEMCQFGRIRLQTDRAVVNDCRAPVG
jgi:hypothetical protein